MEQLIWRRKIVLHDNANSQHSSPVWQAQEYHRDPSQTDKSDQQETKQHANANSQHSSPALQA